MNYVIIRAGPFSREAMRTFSLQAKGVRRSKGPRMGGTRDEPRESFGRSNSIADSHLGSQRVTAGGDGEHKTDRKWGHRRRQLVGCRDLRVGKIPK